MFTRFLKRAKLKQTEEELQHEFEKEKANFSGFISTQTYQFLKDYLEAKVEINRDKLELLDPLQQGKTLIKLQAQNEFIRDFITEVESMRTLAEIEVSREV